MPLTSLMQRYLHAFETGDLETVRDCFTADATWTVLGDLPISKVWTGRDAIVDDFLGTIGGSIFAPGTVRFTHGEPLVAGTTLVLEWQVTARSADGRPYENAYCGVFETRDGRISAVREYMDTVPMAQTLFAPAA